MQSTYINRINQVYPDLAIEKVKQIDIGQNNDVLEINDSLIFRFPKYKEGVDKLIDEADILAKAKEMMRDCAIPDPIYQSFGKKEVGKVFAGYRKIEGVSLQKPDITGAGKLETSIRSFSLVNFLLRLHAASTDGLDEAAPDLEAEYNNLFDRIQRKLFPYMRSDAKREVSGFFEDFFAQVNTFHFKPVLIHGDFGASNLLWDSKKLELTGVIDFGESGVGDPAYDFAGVLASYGYEFFKQCVDNYYDNETGIEHRALFYQKTFALLEALHGVEHNDELAFKAGMRGYM
ncbi:phosphotransferase family protein [Virgibacillus ihumii]|uniref:phosphotransferase family protein n=1 Tax=Virgibacillus ihumii TaxID=2686091 RepID=UPI00157D619D|nr:aminoglycoside phosphotransferase family protein [Virgibacillus ihumii]